MRLLVGKLSVTFPPGCFPPAQPYIPADAGLPYSRAGELGEEQRAAIEGWLNQGRTLDSAVEQMCGMVEKQVVGEIEGALEGEREGMEKGG